MCCCCNCFYSKEMSEDPTRWKDSNSSSHPPSPSPSSPSPPPTFHTSPGSSHDEETGTGGSGRADPPLSISHSLTYVITYTEHRQPVCRPVEPPTFLFIQMQLCQKESLKDWLRVNIDNRVRVTVLKYFKQVCSCFVILREYSSLLLTLSFSLQTLDAVVYLHSKGLMHRDLKVGPPCCYR